MKGERIMQNEWIVISEYCDKCHIEPTFIDMLCESGLIDVEQEGGERYLPFSELPDVERYSRMYYDLSINMEGIDAIHHLLARMEEMQALRKRSVLYTGTMMLISGLPLSVLSLTVFLPFGIQFYFRYLKLK